MFKYLHSKYRDSFYLELTLLGPLRSSVFSRKIFLVNLKSEQNDISIQNICKIYHHVHMPSKCCQILSLLLSPMKNPHPNNSIQSINTNATNRNPSVFNLDPGKPVSFNYFNTAPHIKSLPLSVPKLICNKI